MAEVSITLNERELTVIRVSMLIRLNALKKAIDKTDGDADVAEVREDAQRTYDELRELMNGKLWEARKQAG